MNEARRRVLVAWTPAVLHGALIWIVSSMSNPDFIPVAEIPLKDKGVHFLVFGALAAFTAHGLLRSFPGRSRPALFALAVSATAAWGALDEFHQRFVPGRSPELLDVVADTIGAIGGAGLRVAVALVFDRRGPPRA